MKRHRGLVHGGLEPSPSPHGDRTFPQAGVASPAQSYENVTAGPPSVTPHRGDPFVYYSLSAQPGDSASFIPTEAATGGDEPTINTFQDSSETQY